MREAMTTKVLFQGEWSRDEWTKWGYHFGWELESSDRSRAEFRFKADNEQGCEYIVIPNRVRIAIDRAIDDAGAIGVHIGEFACLD
mgnify:CR=1 FL=1